MRRTRSCSVALLLLLVSCGPRTVTAPAPVPPAPEPLDEVGIRALAALLRLEDERVLDTALVARYLTAEHPEVRARAALAAGRLRDRAATPLLLGALADPDADVRTRTAFALGELADSSTRVVDALGRVALQDATSPAVEATGALGRLGVEAARAFIDTLLVDEMRDPLLRQEAVIVAWRLPHDSGTIRRLAAVAGSADAELRWRAAYSLARTGGTAAVPALLRAAGDADARVRANAVRGLTAPAADSAGERVAALSALLAVVSDTHPHARINALRLLPGYGDDERIAGALVDGLRDSDANVAIAAAQAVAQLADDVNTTDVATALAAAVDDATRANGLRTAALASLTRIDGARATSRAVQWAASSEWLLRMHAARALGALQWTTAAQPLQRLARDTHPLVAATALTAVQTAVQAGGTRRIFLEALGARHPLVRAAAARGLARDATPADLEPLLLAYDRARQDTIPDAALAALQGLQNVARTGTPVESTFFLRFGRHGAPADPAVHRAVGQFIGRTPADWGEPRPDMESRADAFYVDIVRSWIEPALNGAEPPLVTMTTHHGDIVVELAAADAPLTVHNFVTLIGRSYYDGSRWHRVVPNFVIQDGDPRGDGSGSPGHVIRDEINPLRYLRGTLGMAHSGPDTGGGQYFITHSPQPHLDGGYTVFGRVVAGMDVVDRVVQEDPLLGIRMGGTR